MKTTGHRIRLQGKDSWEIQQVIIPGRKTPKWGVWRNGTHIGSERTKRRAVAVVEYWPRDIPATV